MFEIYLDGLFIMLNDEKSAVKNSKIKFTRSIAQFLITFLQNFAAIVVNNRWLSTADNIEDALTNKLTGKKRIKLFGD